MKICVLGAGVIGVSTAYALARAGHEVRVIDRATDVAAGASHANGAQLSFSYVDPFAGPGTVKQLPAYLLGLDPAVRLGLSLSPAYLSWGLSFLRNCTKKRAAENMMLRAALAKSSEAALALFTSECAPKALKPTGRGKIILAATSAHFADMEIAAQTKSAMGIPMKALSVEACTHIEPALKDWQGKFTGGLYAPGDMALDTQTYCKALKTRLERRFGAVFHMSEAVLSVNMDGDGVSGVTTDKSRHECDRVICCLGGQSADLLKHYGVSIPVYPMQGYSVTLKAKTGSSTVSITDAKNKMVFANLGGRIRIAGFMDSNQPKRRAEKRGRELLERARHLWPAIADYDSGPNFWTGFRPMTPSGVPVIGETNISGLYVNAGHGALGYTFAAGSGMRIAELIGDATGSTWQDYERQYYA